MLKTYEGWKGDLDDYLKVGDEVDQAMVDYAIGVMPPIAFGQNFVQIGEPHSHVAGRPTYSTFYRWNEKWIWAGNRYRGTAIYPPDLIPSAS